MVTTRTIVQILRIASAVSLAFALIAFIGTFNLIGIRQTNQLNGAIFGLVLAGVLWGISYMIEKEKAKRE